MNNARNYYQMQLETHPLAPPEVGVSDQELSRFRELVRRGQVRIRGVPSPAMNLLPFYHPACVWPVAGPIPSYLLMRSMFERPGRFAETRSHAAATPQLAKEPRQLPCHRSTHYRAPLHPVSVHRPSEVNLCLSRLDRHSRNPGGSGTKSSTLERERAKSRMGQRPLFEACARIPIESI